MKKFISGIIIGALVFGTLGAYATTEFIARRADFPVLVNGQQFQATTGEILEVNGRTYLPVRDMANALNIPINWNETLGRVEVGTAPTSAPQPTPTPAPTVQYYNEFRGIVPSFGLNFGVQRLDTVIAEGNMMMYFYPANFSDNLIDMYVALLQENGFTFHSTGTTDGYPTVFYSNRLYIVGIGYIQQWQGQRAFLITIQ